MAARLDRGPSDLPVVSYEAIPPSPKGAVRALARIGYRLEEALADIIDNSIDAAATHVTVRFVYNGNWVKRVVIADNGHGMTRERLRAAMQVGSDIGHSPHDLGKYGTGMKTASFSICEQLTVASRAKGESSGMCWARREAESGWRCGVIDDRAIADLLDVNWDHVKIGKHGTLILWDEVERLQPRKASAEQYLRGVVRNSSLHLGLVFHRFLQKKSVQIRLTIYKEGRKSTDYEVDVEAIDPFAYPESGDPHYPRDFTFSLGDLGRLRATAHVWPKKSKAIEYRLGSGKVAERQGFYFYRNDRLIQAGGWNGVINQDDEPHLSLARVAISLPPGMDDAFGLKVQKNAVEVPAGFAEAVQLARAGGLSFESYRADARKAYGRVAPRSLSQLPVVLGGGVHSNVRNRIVKELAPGHKRMNKVRIKWAKHLQDGVFFDIDVERRQIVLNQRYRSGEGNRNGDGGEVQKTLLFLLLREEFQKKRTSRKRDEWMDICNRLLIAAWHSES